jgi:hypothetical protein
MSKFILSTVLLLQSITPSIVGGGELPDELISDRWKMYNDALDIERAILEKARLKEALVLEKKEELKIVKYRISRHFRPVSQKLHWNNYTRVISRLESSHRYDVVNQFGYLGKYQINKDYLMDYGFTGTKKEFLADKLSQELVMANYTYNNMLSIKKFKLDKFIGKEVNGIEITLFGMMASAHLVGIKSLDDYLSSNGEIITRDGNKTSIEKYMKVFS